MSARRLPGSNTFCQANVCSANKRCCLSCMGVAGQDIISEGYMKPRSKAKPNFAQAAPAPQQQAAPQSSAAALCPISTHSTVSEAGSTDAAQDGHAERRASGQGASTSQPGPGMASATSSNLRNGRLTYRGRSRGKGTVCSGPAAPFASISLHHATAMHTSRKPHTGHALSASPEAAAVQLQQSSDASLSSAQVSTATADIALQQHLHSAQLPGLATQDREHVSHEHISLTEQCPYAGHSSQPARNAATNPVGDLAAQDPWAVEKTFATRAPAPPATDTSSNTRQCKTGPSAFPQLPHEPHAYSSAAQAAPPQPRRLGPSAFPQLPHEEYAYSTRASQSGAHVSSTKPGPSAFPQPTHEICLQRMAADLQSSTASPCSSQTTTTEQPSSATATAQAPDAQQPQGQAHTQQGGDQHVQLRQQAMTHHGGYMQREGHERLPRRRTTRSILRGVDLQTGEQIFAVSLHAQAYSGVIASSLHAKAFPGVTSAVALLLHGIASVCSPYRQCCIISSWP